MLTKTLPSRYIKNQWYNALLFEYRTSAIRFINISCFHKVDIAVCHKYGVGCVCANTSQVSDDTSGSLCTAIKRTDANIQYCIQKRHNLRLSIRFTPLYFNLKNIIFIFFIFHLESFDSKSSGRLPYN